MSGMSCLFSSARFIKVFCQSDTTITVNYCPRTGVSPRVGEGDVGEGDEKGVGGVESHLGLELLILRARHSVVTVQHLARYHLPS